MNGTSGSIGEMHLNMTISVIIITGNSFYLRVQNLGSSSDEPELSSQSLTRSQNLEAGMHLPFVQANSESEHPIKGSLMSNLYAAAVPKSSLLYDSVVVAVKEILFRSNASLEEVGIAAIVENISLKSF